MDICGEENTITDMDLFIIKDYPKSLANSDEREQRRALLQERHMLPLTSYVEEIRRKQGKWREVPYFDPLDGGINAKCLFALEAPGPKAVKSGFVSRNNPDETARNFFEFNKEAGIPRRLTITWNIVPWYLGTGKQIRPARRADIDEGLPYLYQLINLLPGLGIIVLVGKKAQKITKKLARNFDNIHIYHCYHPSPLFVNNKPQNRMLIINELRRVAEMLNDQSGS